MKIYCLRLALVSVMVSVFVGCASSSPKMPSPMAIVKPQSILIVPVVNNSVEVEAATYVLSTLTTAVADRGYYVFPVNTTKVVMEHEGWYEPAEIHQLPPDMIANLFGADAILYVTINKWTNEYILISSRTVIDLSYRIVSSTGEDLWSARKYKEYNPTQNNSTNNLFADLIANAVVSAMERASPKYLPMTREANQEVFVSGHTRLPPGPYYGVWDPAIKTDEHPAK